MKEIEIKFKIENREELVNKLKDLGCKFEEELSQEDSIFVLDSSNAINDCGKEDSIWLRIRRENGESILNLKKQSSKLMESKEIEFMVDSYEKCQDLLTTLGYEIWVVVNKKRLETKYNKFNICIDEVERLGSFVEIEIVTEETEDVDIIEKEILDLCDNLGIDKNNRVNKHYDTMIYELDN